VAIDLGGLLSTAILKLKGENSELKRALEESKRAADQAMKGVADSTKKAADAQKGLEDQVGKVGDALDGTEKKATSWGDRVGAAFMGAFDKFEKGAHGFGDAVNTVGEVFGKAQRAAKAFGYELDPMIVQFGEMAEGIGKLAMEASKLPGIIRQIIAANAASGGMGVGGKALAAAGALGAGVYVGSELDKAGYGDETLYLASGPIGWGALAARELGAYDEISDLWRDNSEENYQATSSANRASITAQRQIYRLQRAQAARNAQAIVERNIAMATIARNQGAQLEVGRGGGGGGGGGGGYGGGTTARGLKYFVETPQGPMPVFEAGVSGSLGAVAGGGTEIGAPPAARLGVSAGGLADQYTNLAAQLQREHRVSVLQSVFGDPKEFDLYAEKMEMISGAVGVFSSALSSSFEAWKSGQASAVEAVKALPKAILSSGATMLFGKAIEHGAMAVASWAWGDMVDAAKHGKAAAVLGGAALTVGGLARALGGSAPGAGAGAGSYAGGGGPVVTQAGGGPSNTYIIYDSSARRQSERWRAKEVSEDLERARERSGGGTDTVVYS
jgi:hypothetical protein